MSLKVLDTRSPSFKSSSLNQILASIWGDQKKATVGIQTLFQEQGWFHRAVDLRAKAIQNMPWSITKTGSENVLWDCDMPEIPEELAFAENLPRLLYVKEAALVTVGKAYTLKESEGRSVDSLFYFNPLKVEPVKTSASGIVAYKRQVNNGTETYPAEDMIALFHPDPFVESGPAAQNSGKKNAQVLRALDGFLVSFLDKGLIKATLLSVEGGEHAQPDQLNKLKDRWKKLLAGWANAGEHGLFNSKVTPHTIGDGLKDINNGNLTKEQREAVCAALGIPFSLMMSNAANFATAEIDQVSFYTNTVNPEAKFIQRELNKQLFSPLGYQFAFHPKKLEVMQRYELDKAAKVVAVVGGPVLTQDEGRELLGYEALGSNEVVIDAREEEPRQLEQGETQETIEDEQKAIEAIVLRVLEDRKPQPVTVDAEWKPDGVEIDVKAWKRKIAKKGRDVKFSPDHLNDYETAIIRQRLDTDEPLDEVFKPPFVGF